MDPDCAICSAPASHACDCEAKGLEIAIRQAEARIMNSIYSDIRTWVRGHAQDYALEYFRLLTERRKTAHAQHIKRLTAHAYHYYHAPPHPKEIAAVQAILKKGIDDDWRSSVQRYPEVLEYFYSLVEVTLPSDDEQAVKDPPLSALNGRRPGHPSNLIPIPTSELVTAPILESCSTCVSYGIVCDNTRPFCLRCKEGSRPCKWPNTEPMNSSDSVSESGRYSILDSGIGTMTGSIAPSEMGKPYFEPQPDDDTPQTLPIDSTTIAEQLMNTNVEHLTVVTGCVPSKNEQSWLGQSSGRLRSNLERLVLWRSGIGPGESTLDDILSSSTEVQSSVVAVLFQLSQIIYALMLFAQLDFSTDDPRIQPANMYQLLKSASVIMGRDSISSNEEFESPYNLDMEPSELVHDLETYIDCLMDLSLAIQTLPETRALPKLEDIFVEDPQSSRDDVAEPTTESQPIQPKEPKLSIRSTSGKTSEYVPREAERNPKLKERVVDIQNALHTTRVPTIEEETESDAG